MNTKALAASSPALQGVPSKAILKWLDAVEENNCGFHGFMLARHDHIIADGWWAPFSPALPHMLYSLSKSYTSTAVGFAISEGLLSLEDKVLSFFPEEAPENPSGRLKSLTVRNLLTMAHGQGRDANLKTLYSQDWVRTFLRHPQVTDPGTEFLYSASCTYMCSAIVQKVTGQRIFDYLIPRLFLPLGIDPQEAYWEDCPHGICKGGTGLHMRLEGVLRFGLTLLHEGRFDGQQVIPAEWVKQATAKQIDNSHWSDNPDWANGYGFQFWQCTPEGVYRGDGAYGQFCVVMPKQDMVLVINSATSDMQKILSLTWDILLPALRDKTIEEDLEDLKALEKKLSSLQVPLPEGTGTGASIQGDYIAETAFRELESIRINLGERNQLTFRFAGKDYTLICENDRWHICDFVGMAADVAECKAAAAGVWLDDSIYRIHLHDMDVPYSAVLDFCFDADGCTLTYTLPRDWNGAHSDIIRLRKK